MTPGWWNGSGMKCMLFWDPSAISRSPSRRIWSWLDFIWNVSAQQNERLQQFCEIQDRSAADLLSVPRTHALEVASGKQSSPASGERATILQGSRGKNVSVRCGIGYDLHRLAEGRKLIVGGIELPFAKGSVGHLDGDCLVDPWWDGLLWRR